MPDSVHLTSTPCIAGSAARRVSVGRRIPGPAFTTKASAELTGQDDQRDRDDERTDECQHDDITTPSVLMA